MIGQKFKTATCELCNTEIPHGHLYRVHYFVARACLPVRSARLDGGPHLLLCADCGPELCAEIDSKFKDWMRGEQWKR